MSNHKDQDSKVIVLVPRSMDGGVANYFNSIKNLFSNDVTFFYRGKPNWPDSSSKFQELYRIFKDFYLFWKLLGEIDFDLVHVNTFFGSKSLKRDGIFVLLAKLRKKKAVLFFRGWDKNYEEKVSRRYLKVFKYVYFKCDAFITLSSYEKNRLIEWGFTECNIFTETTTVDSTLVNSIDEKYIFNKNTRPQEFSLLFISRIEKAKGIYETIDAYGKIRSHRNNVVLTIAGKGSELEKAKLYVTKKNIKGISFKGFVAGEEKKQVFLNAHILVFPTYFAEGMPNAVLEAFAFGLPVITTKAGGLKDIFTDNKNGLLVEPKNSNDIKLKILNLIEDPEKMKSIGLTNHNYAKERFVSTEVVKRLENIYEIIISKPSQ